MVEPRAVAVDEEHSHLLRRARRSLSHGEGGISGPLACAVESRPDQGVPRVGGAY
jgi:hypothetical protein